MHSSRKNQRRSKKNLAKIQRKIVRVKDSMIEELDKKISKQLTIYGLYGFYAIRNIQFHTQ